jgi:hypothetical protein
MDQCFAGELLSPFVHSLLGSPSLLRRPKLEDQNKSPTATAFGIRASPLPGSTLSVDHLACPELDPGISAVSHSALTGFFSRRTNTYVEYNEGADLFVGWRSLVGTLCRSNGLRSYPI